MIEICADNYTIESITLNNIDKYEDVFYSNKEYYMLTDGRTATKTDCIETVDYSIDGIEKRNIHNIGFCDEENPVACLFLIEGYPDEDILWLGLFLVHEKYKRKGLGTKFIKALIDFLKETSIRHIRLSVQDNNISGLSFWNQMGFSVIEKTDCGMYNNLTMEYAI